MHLATLGKSVITLVSVTANLLEEREVEDHLHPLVEICL